MTLEEINDIDDKDTRLKLLKQYIDQLTQERTDAEEVKADEQMNASRDETGGMMSRYGKP
jgi:hypothetical protein